MSESECVRNREGGRRGVGVGSHVFPDSVQPVGGRGGRRSQERSLPWAQLSIYVQLLYINVQWLQSGLVFKACIHFSIAEMQASE